MQNNKVAGRQLPPRTKKTALRAGVSSNLRAVRSV